jgi:hypothetical protein
MASLTKETDMYQIINEKTGETIANNLTDAALAQWWKANESKFFGVSVNEGTIVVANTEGWAA